MPLTREAVRRVNSDDAYTHSACPADPAALTAEPTSVPVPVMYEEVIYQTPEEKERELGRMWKYLFDYLGEEKGE